MRSAKKQVNSKQKMTVTIDEAIKISLGKEG